MQAHLYVASWSYNGLVQTWPRSADVRRDVAWPLTVGCGMLYFRRHVPRCGAITGDGRESVRQEITIAANDSGRLWTDDIEQWNALCRPEGCIVCRDDLLPSGMHVLAETPMVEAMSMERVPIPGYVYVTSKKHAVEPFDLSIEDQRWFWTDAMLVAQGVADVRRPAKMNYEIHGNTIPHLHMHLFPRTAGDVYVGYVIHHRVEFEHSAEDLEDLRTGIVARLRGAERLA